MFRPNAQLRAVATSVVASTSILQPKEVNEPTRASIFSDSTSADNVDLDATGPSQPAGNDISSKSLYEMDSEALRQAYVPKWDVLNDSILDDPNLFDESARQTCLSAKVRMRLKHVLRGKKRLRGRCVMQEKLLKEKDVEIVDLKARLYLKEAKATEAIRLRGQIVDVEAAEAAQACELESLKEHNVALKSATASTFECEKDKLIDQVSTLEATCFGLYEEVSGYKLFKEWIEEMQDTQVKALSDRVAGGAIGRAIEKGVQDKLAAGIDHGQAGRFLADVFAYNPFAKADYLAAINDLRSVDFSLLAQLESQKYASIIDIINLLHLEGSAAATPKDSQLQPLPEQLMVPIHRLEDQVVIRETSLSFSLEVAHNHVRRLRGDAMACRLSLTDAMVPLVEPLSVRSLTGGALSAAYPALERMFPLRSLSLYAPLPNSSVTSYGPSYLVLKVGMPISTRITVYVPYVSENGVSPLLDLIIVRCAHKTYEISSNQFLLLSSNRALIPSSKLLFALSTKPLAPNLQTMLSYTNFLMWAPVMVATGFASIHLILDLRACCMTPHGFLSRHSLLAAAQHSVTMARERTISVCYGISTCLAAYNSYLPLFFWKNFFRELVDAILLSASAFLFSPLGTCLIENSLKVLLRVLTLSKYLVMTGSFAMRPATKASYSASLLVASNLNLRAYVNFIPSRFVIIRPAPKPSMHDDSSVNSIHGSESSFLSSMGVSGESSSGRSTMKSARIYPLTDVLGI
nr:hypothetical protein [Tanacetum cinerariifolium]